MGLTCFLHHVVRLGWHRPSPPIRTVTRVRGECAISQDNVPAPAVRVTSVLMPIRIPKNHGAERAGFPPADGPGPARRGTSRNGAEPYQYLRRACRNAETALNRGPPPNVPHVGAFARMGTGSIMRVRLLGPVDVMDGGEILPVSGLRRKA